MDQHFDVIMKVFRALRDKVCLSCNDVMPLWNRLRTTCTKTRKHQLLFVIVVVAAAAVQDVFERFYKQHLARRLLLNKAASTEAEHAFLQRLQVRVRMGWKWGFADTRAGSSSIHTLACAALSTFTHSHMQAPHARTHTHTHTHPSPLQLVPPPSACCADGVWVGVHEEAGGNVPRLVSQG